MTYGIKVIDSGSTVQLDTSVRLGKLLGTITVSSNGSLTDAGFATGTPWYITMPTSAGGSPGYFPVTVTFSGTTMSWTTSNSCTIYYGVY